MPARERPTRDIPNGLVKLMAVADVELTAPFHGLATSGGIEPGLFSLAPTGISTAPLRKAATDFLRSLTASEAELAMFPIETEAWRRWNNTHPGFMRHGICLELLGGEQREKALGLLAAAMSDEGYTTARDVMHINETLREMTGRDVEYGEWLYWLSVMGQPSEIEPWGFQLDGHHVNVNCFVLGDQFVMTPTFLGSEVVLAETGRYRGTRVFARDEAVGLQFAQALSPDQFRQAVIGDDLPGDVLATCYRDNLEMNSEGIGFADLRADQQQALLELIGLHIGRMRRGHAAVKLAEIERHLDRTFFAWIGERSGTGVFYYRIHSPVVLVEFDYLSGVVFDNDEPSRNHIHTIVRTPNGNDYGKDLLRQHYELAHGGVRPREILADDGHGI
jgi:hypothetical protein